MKIKLGFIFFIIHFNLVGICWAQPFHGQDNNLITFLSSAEIYEENWVGLWIEEGAPFPEFTNFNHTDSYILITNSYYVIGQTNWAGQRWGQFEGDLKLTDNDNAEIIDGDCHIKLSIKKTDFIYSLSVLDNNFCGGVNVRFNGNFILFQTN